MWCQIRPFRIMAESNAVDRRDSIYQEHVSSIPAGNRRKLSKKLDFENEGLDVHLGEIADSMINWREKLATPLGLSEAEVHDIIFSNEKQPILQQ